MLSYCRKPAPFFHRYSTPTPAHPSSPCVTTRTAAEPTGASGFTTAMGTFLPVPSVQLKLCVLQLQPSVRLVLRQSSTVCSELAQKGLQSLTLEQSHPRVFWSIRHSLQFPAPRSCTDVSGRASSFNYDHFYVFALGVSNKSYLDNVHPHGYTPVPTAAKWAPGSTMTGKGVSGNADLSGSGYHQASALNMVASTPIPTMAMQTCSAC